MERTRHASDYHDPNSHAEGQSKGELRPRVDEHRALLLRIKRGEQR